LKFIYIDTSILFKGAFLLINILTQRGIIIALILFFSLEILRATRFFLLNTPADLQIEQIFFLTQRKNGYR